MHDAPLKLSAAEISAAFRDSIWAERFPPILSIEQASQLIQVPVATLREWRSRGLLVGCCRRRGKRLSFFRDRLIANHFNGDEF